MEMLIDRYEGWLRIAYCKGYKGKDYFINVVLPENFLSQLQKGNSMS